MTLHMSETEIITSYREARHKYTQIGILADLNDCHRSVIRAVLARNGLLPEAPKANRRGRKPTTPYDLGAVTEMIAQGYTAKQIAARYNVTPDAIRSYCKRNLIAMQVGRPKNTGQAQTNKNAACGAVTPQAAMNE